MQNGAITFLLFFVSIALFGSGLLLFVHARDYYRLEEITTESQEKPNYSTEAVLTFIWAAICMYFSAFFFMAFVYYTCYQRPTENKKSETASDNSSKDK